MKSRMEPNSDWKAVLSLFLWMVAGGFFPGSAQAETVSHLFQKVNASVVVIYTVERGRLADNPEETGTTIGVGSGVVVSADGLIMTAAHVVQVADAVEVKFQSGVTVPARVIQSVPWADLALLRLEKTPENLSFAPLGDSNQMEIGDRIFIIGAPRNFDHTLSVGYISAKRSANMFSGSQEGYEYFQTDAAIDVGNSGGPMFNMNGEVVGIVSQFFSLSGSSAALGLALASNTARELLLERKPFWSGMDLYPLSGPMATALNVPQPFGLLVQRVAKHSPAQRAGIRAGTIRITTKEGPLLIGGDIILAVEKIRIQGEGTHIRDIQKKIQHRVGAGKPIRTQVLRNGEIIEIELDPLHDNNR